MPRLRHRYTARQRASLLLTACLALGAMMARAQNVQTSQTSQTGQGTQNKQPVQTALITPDPLAPMFETNPRHLPRFKKLADQDSISLQPPPAFTLPPSGIGTTGFDASNASKKPRVGTKPGPAANAPPTTPDTLAPEAAFGPAAQMSAPVAVSPYQVPPPPLATSAFAEAPGSPPVPEIGPIRKPLKKRKPRESDPYAPLGIRAGAFYLYPSIDVLGGYDSNPERTSGGKGSSLYIIAPELRVQSDWSRHSLKADLRGSYTGYNPDQTPTLSRPYFESNVNGRIDVTDRTHILLDSHTLISTDNPNSPNLQSGLAKLPLYIVFGGDSGIEHRFNRFEISLKGAAERTVYQNSDLTNGTSTSNEDQNYDQYGGTLRDSYDLLPGVKPYVEIEADNRVHDLNTDFSGYQRDSKGVTGTIGTTLALSDLLNGEVAIGYTRRNYQDQRLPPVDGLVGNASLIWIPSALDTVKLTGSSTVGESTIIGVSGILYRNVGLQLDHAFRRWLIGTIKAGIAFDDYVGSPREDRLYSASAGFTYKLNRYMQAKGEFDQYWLRSSVSGNNYIESVFQLGLYLQK